MEVKPATRTKLGAIIVGEDFNITDDGILTVREENFQHDDYVEFSREKLEKLFEESRRRQN